MRPLSSSGSGGGAGYCPRVCPRSAPSFSAIVLRRGDPTRDRGRKIGWCLAAGGRGLTQGLERAKGIEPSYAAWEAAVLPLNYAREPISNARKKRRSISFAVSLSCTRQCMVLAAILHRTGAIRQSFGESPYL